MDGFSGALATFFGSLIIAGIIIVSIGQGRANLTVEYRTCRKVADIDACVRLVNMEPAK